MLALLLFLFLLPSRFRDFLGDQALLNVNPIAHSQDLFHALASHPDFPDRCLGALRSMLKTGLVSGGLISLVQPGYQEVLNI